jgi:hypothetical protein
MNDGTILDDIAARLEATGAFDAVQRGALPEQYGQGSAALKMAVVAAGTWEESDTSDDPTIPQSYRQSTWNLTLLVRQDDPAIRENTLTELLTASQGALDGQALGGGTIPALSRLRRGTYQTPVAPEQRMTVRGEFSYWIEGFNASTDSDYFNT